MDPLMWIVIAVSVLLTLLLLPWIAILVVQISTETASAISEVFGGGFRDLTDHMASRNVRRQIEERLRKHRRAHRLRRFFGRQPEDAEMFAATVLLRETVGACCATHHDAADVLGVEHMRELENYIICAANRTRVVETQEFVLNSLIEEKELVGNRTLSRMAIGLDAMHDVCTDCMLLKFKRSDAPQSCDPAKFMGCEQHDPGGSQ